ncbi:metallophosphoesterase family protein [Microbacterium sp. 1P10UB]|uniref:metallophosphoesterase family protein n=1 Tax=unclassified Microbacterium TaxID=2609290 RepID=UPI0039A0A0A0
MPSVRRSREATGDRIVRYPTFDFDQVDFVTSDTHFGHARISELAGRPFRSVEEMDAELVRRWNEAVGPYDVVLHLGDVALGSIQHSLPLIAVLHGRRFLVPGNHDRVSTATQSRSAIERFTPLHEDAGWNILREVIEGLRGGRRLIASHYAYRGDSQDVDRHVSHRPVDDGTPLIHGHTHSRENGPDGNQFHVGVDAFGYAPVPFELIDAWLADLQSEEGEMAAIVRDRSALLEAAPLSEVAERFGVDLGGL